MIQTVVGQLQAANGILQVNLEGVDHETSLIQPVPAGNCLNWIVGHLVSAYDNLLPVLEEQPVLRLEQKEIYQRGAPPLSDAAKAVPFDELRQAWATAHERVIEGLTRFPEERLPEPAPFSPGKNPDETKGSLFGIFAFHQAYHVGQLGLGRRVADLDGAVA